MGNAVQSTAESSQDAVGFMFSAVGLSLGRRLGLFEDRILTNAEAKIGWIPKVETVSPENYKDAAKDRLAVVNKVSCRNR